MLSTDNPEFQAQQRARALGIIEGSERRKRKRLKGPRLVIVALAMMSAYLSGVVVTIAAASAPLAAGRTHAVDVDIDISGLPEGAAPSVAVCQP